jgi:putative flavoprotein involved in K+ transport
MNTLGLEDKVIEAGAVRQPPLLISGANGGHTVDLRRYAADGMMLAGRFVAARDGVASFAPDLAANLAGGDESHAAFLRAADAFAAQSDLVLPAERGPGCPYPEPVGIETLDLHGAGIGSVIWATGYRYDFGWVELPVFAADGRPIHRRGVTDVPGAYFLGLQYLHKTKSSFLSGVGEDATYLAEQIGAGQQSEPFG